MFDLVAAEAGKLLPHRIVVAVEQGAPLSVAELGGPLCRIDDIGEHHCGQYPIDIRLAARSGQEFLSLVDDPIRNVALVKRCMIGSRQLDISGARQRDSDQARRLSRCLRSGA